jgi:hypothetical protein
MANIKKTFNFRNGVQVDDDNLIVNATGLVGIGTTIPTEALDVRGKIVSLYDVNVPNSGELNVTSGIITNLTVTGNFNVGNNNYSGGTVGEGIVVGNPAGIVTSTNAGVGIVTYYGDGRYLQGLPTSQWSDKDAGLGFLSIYNAGHVGVSTDDPRFALQIGGTNNPQNFQGGIGIGSEGSLVATGIVTAGTFSGPLSGDVTGTLTGSVAGNINSGISTIIQIKSTNVNVSGVVTATTFDGDLAGNIVSGISTVGLLSATDVVVSGAITATTFSGDFSGNVNSGIATFTTLSVTNINSDPAGIATLGRVTSSTSNIGIATVSTLNVGEKLGIGIQVPTNDLQILNTGIATVNIKGSQALLSIGQEFTPTAGVAKSTGVFRYGYDDKSLDIINTDSGDLTNYIHFGSQTGINTGSFKWNHRTNNNIMTLTYDGKLGINKETPLHALDVVGTTRLTGDATVAGNLNVTGGITGSLNIDTITTNLNTTSGISTFNNVNISRFCGVSTVAIGTEFDNVVTGTDIDAQFGNTLLGNVGIGTTVVTQKLNVSGGAWFNGVGLGTINPSATHPYSDFTFNSTVYQHNIGFSTSSVTFFDGSNVRIEGSGTVGVGTTSVRSAVDFGDAGTGLMNGALRHLILPRVSTAERGNITNPIGGSLIYNTTQNRLEFYQDGVGWRGLSHTA